MLPLLDSMRNSQIVIKNKPIKNGVRIKIYSLHFFHVVKISNQIATISPNICEIDIFRTMVKALKYELIKIHTIQQPSLLNPIEPSSYFRNRK